MKRLFIIALILPGCGLPDYMEIHAGIGDTDGNALSTQGTDHDFDLRSQSVGLVLGWRLAPTQVELVARPVHFDSDGDSQELVRLANAVGELGQALEQDKPRPASIAESEGWFSPEITTALAVLGAALMEGIRRWGGFGKAAQRIGKSDDAAGSA